jgi:dienelactone hydrolase
MRFCDTLQTIVRKCAPQRSRVLMLVGAGLLWLLAGGAIAQAPELDASLNETVLTIPNKAGLFTIELETTLYRPDGNGPFPVVVINHGKAPGDTRFQSRFRPAVAARFFMQRGYAVVVPMRQGFSKSGGSYIGGNCNIESNGRVQADDVKAVLDYVAAQPWADRERMLVVGQSHGGWTTLAFGARNYPGVKGIANFAGGLRQENCPAWQIALAGAAANYAKETRLPSLWFYGDNDSYFDETTYRRMHEQYATAGGNAKLIAFGKFGSDSHSLFGARAGAPIWQPEMTRFLVSIGLPSEVQPGYAKYGTLPATPTPERTDFAALNDVAQLPHVRDTGREGYKVYLTKELPRAFALAPNGAWGFGEGGDDPLRRALANCNRRGNGECRLYSVDDYVVWKAP